VTKYAYTERAPQVDDEGFSLRPSDVGPVGRSSKTNHPFATAAASPWEGSDGDACDKEDEVMKPVIRVMIRSVDEVQEDDNKDALRDIMKQMTLGAPSANSATAVGVLDIGLGSTSLFAAKSRRRTTHLPPPPLHDSPAAGKEEEDTQTRGNNKQQEDSQTRGKKEEVVANAAQRQVANAAEYQVASAAEQQTAGELEVAVEVAQLQVEVELAQVQPEQPDSRQSSQQADSRQSSHPFAGDPFADVATAAGGEALEFAFPADPFSPSSGDGAAAFGASGVDGSDVSGAVAHDSVSGVTSLALHAHAFGDAGFGDTLFRDAVPVSGKGGASVDAAFCDWDPFESSTPVRAAEEDRGGQVGGVESASAQHIQTGDPFGTAQTDKLFAEVETDDAFTSQNTEQGRVQDAAHDAAQEAVHGRARDRGQERVQDQADSLAPPPFSSSAPFEHKPRDAPQNAPQETSQEEPQDSLTSTPPLVSHEPVTHQPVTHQPVTHQPPAAAAFSPYVDLEIEVQEKSYCTGAIEGTSALAVTSGSAARVQGDVLREVALNQASGASSEDSDTSSDSDTVSERKSSRKGPDKSSCTSSLMLAPLQSKEAAVNEASNTSLASNMSSDSDIVSEHKSTTTSPLSRSTPQSEEILQRTTTDCNTPAAEFAHRPSNVDCVQADVSLLQAEEERERDCGMSYDPVTVARSCVLQCVSMLHCVAVC